MRKHIHIIMASLLVLPLYLPVHSQAEDNKANPSSIESSNEKGELPLKDLRLFTLIFDHIRRSYVEPISDQQLLENAIKGMLGEMDPHSAYFDEKTFTQFQENTQGQFSGVGIEIGSENGFIKIISPIDNTPAQKAGLQAGDLIIKINQETIQGLSVNDASDKIRGPAGSSIEFTVIRQGIDKSLDISVIRGTIKATSVRHRLIKDTIAYIRIAQFQKDTGKEFVKALQQLQSNQAELDGLVIDLRNNPGGILQASVDVVDSLLNDGLVVYTKGRLENSNIRYKATEGDNTNGLPIVILVNGGSASASEIVAGALQDHKRAVIMGTRTFGKGSVQTILPVGDKKGIKLTTARYFTPNGRSIQAQGITPDIIVEPATITAINTGGRITESNLGGHLKNTSSGKKIDSHPQPKNNKTPNNNDHQTKDNQLFEAVNLLKGLAILTNNKTAK